MTNLDTVVNNTPYNDQELGYFKELLLQERVESIEDEKAMIKSAAYRQAINNDKISSQDPRPDNLENEGQERKTDYIFRERNQQKIDEIDSALKRIENKTYGICENTGKIIPKDRLEAIPFTRFSAVARKKDETNELEPT